MEANIKFAKVKEGAIVPSKRDEDVGLDIYACFEEDWIEIAPHTSKLIPTGIASSFNKEWGIVFRERGSTGVKNLKVNAGVIDSGFRSEWFVGLYNGNDIPIYITKFMDGERAPKAENAILYPYTKGIAQALVIPVPYITTNVIDYNELKAIKSERGMGMLGSSNK